MSNPFEIIDARLINIENLLLNLNHAPKEKVNQQSLDQWFSIDDLIKYLPDKPVKSTVYLWTHSLTIPFHKKGKKLTFLKSEIDNWIKSGRKKTAIELKAETDQDLLNKS